MLLSIPAPLKAFAQQVAAFLAPAYQSGVVSLTRTTDATFTDSSGVVQTAASGVLRSLHYVNGVQTILTEPVDTNLCTQSQDFSAWTNVSTCNVTTNTTIAPDGTLTADTLTATLAASERTRPIVFTGDGTKGVAIYLKAGTSARSLFGVRDYTAAVTRFLASVTWSGGVPTIGTSVGSGTIYTTESLAGGWYRIRLAVPGVIAANDNRLRIFPGDNVAGTGTVIAWGGYATNAQVPMSHIVTAAATVQRNADLAYLADARLDPPRTSTIYIRSRNVGAYVNTGATRRVFNIGTDTVTADARLSGGGGSAGATSVFAQHDDGATEVTATATAGSSPAALGAEVEQRIVLNADGSVISGVSVARGAEATATSGAAALAANWANTRLYLSGGLSAENAPCAYERILIVEGVRTMADMRQMAGG